MSYRAPLAELLAVADSVGAGITGIPTDDITSIVFFDGIRGRVLGGLPAGGGASTFLQLTDTPQTFGGLGQMPHITTSVGGGVLLGWRDAPREVPSAVGVTNGHALLANGGSYAWSALPPSLSSLLARGSVYVGNSIGNAAAIAPAGPNTSLQNNGTDTFWASRFFGFAQLTDTPGTLGQPGQLVRVNNAGTALEFFTDIVGAPSLAENSIFVGNSAGQAAALAAGPEGSFFTVTNGVPSWSVLDGIFRARGAWNASTGDPPTESPIAGDYYTVSVAGNFQSIFYGTDDAIYYASGAWHKVEGGQGLTANNSLVGADDTTTATPTAGQGYVWDPTATPQAGAGPGAFALQDFVRATIDPGSGYNEGRVLESDGDQFVSVDKIAMPRLPLLGSLWVNDPVNGPQAIPTTTSTSVLVGNSVTGKPEYKEFQTLLNGATVPNYSLAVQNQVLTGNRSVSVTSNILTIASSGNFAAFAIDGLNRRVITSSTSASGGFTKLELNGDYVALDLQNNATLRLNVPGEGLSPGVAGQSIVSGNLSSSPTWGFPRVVMQAPNDSYWELFIDNDGAIHTVEVAPVSFAPFHPEEIPS